MAAGLEVDNPADAARIDERAVNSRVHQLPVKEATNRPFVISLGMGRAAIAHVRWQSRYREPASRRRPLCLGSQSLYPSGAARTQSTPAHPQFEGQTTM